MHGVSISASNSIWREGNFQIKNKSSCNPMHIDHSKHNYRPSLFLNKSLFAVLVIYADDTVVFVVFYYPSHRRGILNYSDLYCKTG